MSDKERLEFERARASLTVPEPTRASRATQPPSPPPSVKAPEKVIAPDYWEKPDTPVLVLNCDKDSQVPAKQNVAGIVSAGKQGHSDVSNRILPTPNHMFQTAQTGPLVSMVR